MAFQSIKALLESADGMRHQEYETFTDTRQVNWRMFYDGVLTQLSIPPNTIARLNGTILHPPQVNAEGIPVAKGDWLAVTALAKRA